jgi:hypothetical protein
MSRLLSVYAPDKGLAFVSLTQLGDSHNLRAAAARTLNRFYGLESVPQSEQSHCRLFDAALDSALTAQPGLRLETGILWYCKTQTHNSLCDDDWLEAVLARHGIGHWQAQSFSMTHCASGLALLHYLHVAADDRPAIMLCGEKTFHPATSRLSVGVLGEMPLACVVQVKQGHWRLRAAAVQHVPRFYPNAADLPEPLIRDQQQAFPRELAEFLTLLQEQWPQPTYILPYNLNRPLLLQLAARFGWGDRLNLDTLASHGHLFCSDVFLKLSRLPARAGEHVLAFAAGMGLTLAAAWLERAPSSSP